MSTSEIYEKYGVKIINEKDDDYKNTNDYECLPDIEEARERIDRIISIFFSKLNNSHVGLKVSAGIGKSKSALKIAVQQPYKTLFFTPFNDLSLEFAKDHEDVVVIKGRRNFCTNEKARSIPMDSISDYCSNQCPKCTTCTYHTQFSQAETAKVVILNHNYLFCINSHIMKLAASAERIVIDEDIVSKMLIERSLPADTTDTKLLLKIHTDLSNGMDTRTVLNINKDELEEMYKKVRSIGKFNPETEEHRQYRDRLHKRDFYRELVKIANEKDDGRFVNNVWAFTSKQDSKRIFVYIKKKISSIYNGIPILYLDASCNREVVDKTLGIKFTWRKIKAKYHNEYGITFFSGMSMSKQRMARQIETVQKVLNERFRGIPVITYKELQREGWFGNIRGTNRFTGNDLIVLGRQRLSNNDLMKYTRTVFDRTEKELNFELEYRDLRINFVSGNQAVMRKKVYVDKIGKIYEHFNIAETEQAVLRNRPYTPGRVLQITNEVLPVYYDGIEDIAKLFPMSAKPRKGTTIEQEIGVLISENVVVPWDNILLVDKLNKRFGKKYTRNNVKDYKKKKWFREMFMEVKMKNPLRRCMMRFIYYNEDDENFPYEAFIIKVKKVLCEEYEKKFGKDVPSNHKINRICDEDFEFVRKNQ